MIGAGNRGWGMASNQALREWIEEQLKLTGKTQRGLARALNLDNSIVNRLVRGGREIKAAELPLIERYLGERVPSGLAAMAEGEVVPSPPDGYVSVPVYELRAAAGAGAVAVDAEPIYYQIFRESELRAYTGDFAQLFMLEIDGDSNMPTLHTGDRALCDRSQVNPRREGRYVIRIDDVLQVKLISMHPVTKLLTVKSENPLYPTYPDLNPEDVAIIARVVWIGRKLV
jgi:phage repressor protein C with HTH and peptisase S24 domain